MKSNMDLLSEEVAKEAPLHGVRGDPAQTTSTIDYRDEATTEQRVAGDAIAQDFDVTPGNLEQAYKMQLSQNESKLIRIVEDLLARQDEMAAALNTLGQPVADVPQVVRDNIAEHQGLRAMTIQAGEGRKTR